MMRRPSDYAEGFTRMLLKIQHNNGRVLALCGAGLSAPSGLGTLKGSGGMWRKHNIVKLATEDAFMRDAGLVWQYYSDLRHKALRAQPNPAHYALAKFAEKLPNFLCLSQNLDGLSQRARHPPDQLKLLHGSVFDIKCINRHCDYLEKNNYDDPIHPLLTVTDKSEDQTAPQPQSSSLEGSGIHPSKLPRCPKCRVGLLRPGVVWFGESLPQDTISEVDAWIAGGKIDLMLVIGTSASVYPAARYVTAARKEGATVAVVNLEAADEDLGTAGNLGEDDFFFHGNAEKLLPGLLQLPDKPVRNLSLYI